MKTCLDSGREVTSAVSVGLSNPLAPVPPALEVLRGTGPIPHVDQLCGLCQSTASWTCLLPGWESKLPHGGKSRRPGRKILQSTQVKVLPGVVTHRAAPRSPWNKIHFLVPSGLPALRPPMILLWVKWKMGSHYAKNKASNHPGLTQTPPRLSRYQRSLTTPTLQTDNMRWEKGEAMVVNTCMALGVARPYYKGFAQNTTFNPPATLWVGRCFSHTVSLPWWKQCCL